MKANLPRNLGLVGVLATGLVAASYIGSQLNRTEESYSPRDNGSYSAVDNSRLEKEVDKTDQKEMVSLGSKITSIEYNLPIDDKEKFGDLVRDIYKNPEKVKKIILKDIPKVIVSINGHKDVKYPRGTNIEERKKLYDAIDMSRIEKKDIEEISIGLEKLGIDFPDDGNYSESDRLFYFIYKEMRSLVKEAIKESF